MSDIVKNGSPTSSSVSLNKVEKPDLGEVSHELLTLLGLKGIDPHPNFYPQPCLLSSKYFLPYQRHTR